MYIYNIYIYIVSKFSVLS